MAVAPVYFDSSLSDEARRQALYDGSIFIQSPTASSRALIALGREMLEKAFAPHDPRTIYEHMSAEEVAAILGVLKPKFVHHPDCKALIREVLIANLHRHPANICIEVGRQNTPHHVRPGFGELEDAMRNLKQDAA